MGTSFFKIIEINLRTNNRLSIICSIICNDPKQSDKQIIKHSVMNAKLSHFSELSDFLSEKSSVCNYFLSLLDRFKFGQSLRKLRMKKENGASYWICSSTSFSSVSQSENPPVTPSSVFSINRKSQEQVLSFPYTPQDRLAQASLSHGEIHLPHRK